MTELKFLDGVTDDELTKSCNAMRWCRAYFRTYTQCDMLLNIMGESLMLL